MIQIIGLMMAAYIFTRMVDLLTSETAGKVAKTCALLTSIFTLICAIMLLIGGLTTPQLRF